MQGLILSVLTTNQVVHRSGWIPMRSMQRQIIACHNCYPEEDYYFNMLFTYVADDF